MKARLSVAVAILVLLAGCAAPKPPGESGPPSPTPRAGGDFIDGTSAGDAETLNWILAADAASFGYASFTLQSLATYNNQWEVVLRHLARPVEVSADGLTYTITIRDDLKWTDGTPVTAEDYVYTLKNLMFSDWLNYPYQSDWQETVNGEEVFVQPEVVNQTTFTIKKQTVNPEFVDNSIYSLTPYPKHIAVKYEGNLKAFTEAPEFNNLTYTGNLGPYRYQEWVRNDKLVVERNPDYYLGQEDGSPYFNRYITKLLGTPAALHAALEAGDITSAGIDPEQVAKFKQMPRINVYTVPTSGYQLITYNLRDNGWEGFKDQRVRQALAMSINKQTVIDSLLLGFGDPAFSFIPKPSPWYTDEGVPRFGYGDAYNKKEAKRLLLEAGYAVRNPNGSITARNKDGSPVKLIVATNSGNKVREDLAFLTKQELTGLGIEVEIKLIPWATMLRQNVMNKAPGTDQQPGYNNGPDAVSAERWDMIVMGFNTHPIAPSGSRVFFTTSGGLNYWGYSNKTVDDLFQRVRTAEALDETKRKQMYAEISRIIAEDQPAIFISFPRANIGFQANVQGIEPGMQMGYNYHRWFFAQP